MTKPLDVLGGLNEAIVQPLWNDAKNAYWLQRAARERYPVANTALNFVPYVGAATNVDDIVQDVRTQQPGNIPGDLGGLAVNGASTLAALKGLGTVATHSSKAARGIGGIASLGLFGYGNALAQEQNAAAKKYQDMSLADIAEQLKGNK